MKDSKGKMPERPNLSILALVAFIVSFLVARTFTTLNPDTVLIGSAYHIHHFWYGLAMLAIGGWLGISYSGERADRLAAILFGSGGGLIGDEIGLLLTLGDYWTEITYTFVILTVTLSSTIILISRYSRVIREEFAQLAKKNVGLYLGVFLVTVSVAFVLETDNIIIITVSGGLTVLACLIILTHFVQRIKSRP